MNSRDLEQFGIFKRYLMERSVQSRARRIKAEIQRWIEWVDAIKKRDKKGTRNNDLLRAA